MVVVKHSLPQSFESKILVGIGDACFQTSPFFIHSFKFEIVLFKQGPEMFNKMTDFFLLRKYLTPPYHLAREIHQTLKKQAKLDQPLGYSENALAGRC